MEAAITEIIRKHLISLPNLKLFCRDQFFFPDADSGNRNGYRQEYHFVAVSVDTKPIETDILCHSIMGLELPLEAPNIVTIKKIKVNQENGSFFKSLFLVVSTYRTK